MSGPRRSMRKEGERSTVLTRRRLLALPAAAMALLYGPLAGGPSSAGAVLQSNEMQAVLKAELYLNRIKTLHARFVQVSSNGAYAEGEVYIRRPGRLRFEYDPPHPILLIADGLNLLYYDKELKQATFIPLWETPLWFLIRKRVDLSGDIEVTEVEQADGAVRLTLEEKGEGESGAITLVFSDRPFALRKWEVTDAQGITTQVTLLNPELGHEIPDEMFDYSDLNVHGIGPRREGR